MTQTTNGEGTEPRAHTKDFRVPSPHSYCSTLSAHPVHSVGSNSINCSLLSISVAISVARTMDTEKMSGQLEEMKPSLLTRTPLQLPFWVLFESRMSQD